VAFCALHVHDDHHGTKPRGKFDDWAKRDSEARLAQWKTMYHQGNVKW
jgi:hypothetical protein